MTDLVFVQNNQALTNSLLVAEKFGKEHFHVLEALRELIAKPEFSMLVEIQQISNMFSLVEQEIPMPVGDGVKKSPIYIMNRDGFTLLVMGFTGEKALRFKLEYIAAFNRMEEQLKKQLLPEAQMPHLQEVLSLKDTIISNQARIIELMDCLREKEENNYVIQPSVTIIDEKSAVRGRSTRKRAMLTEYENLARFADVFFRNENNFAHPISKFEMIHLYIKFCELEPSQTKISAISSIFNRMLREYCLNNDIVVNPTVVFTCKSDRSEGYIRRPAYETEYKYGIPTVPEQRLLNKSTRCYYFYHENDIPESIKDVQFASGKEGLLS